MSISRFCYRSAVLLTVVTFCAPAVAQQPAAQPQQQRPSITSLTAQGFEIKSSCVQCLSLAASVFLQKDSQVFVCALTPEPANYFGSFCIAVH